MMNPNMAEALRDNFTKPDGPTTEGAESELVVAQTLVDTASGRDRIVMTTDHEVQPELAETVEEKLAKLQAEVLEKSTPWWLLEYFYWERTQSGNLRLVPIPDAILNIVARIPERLEKAKQQFANEVIEHAEHVAQSYIDLDETDAALFSDDGDKEFRHNNLLKRCIEHLMFAAQTRRELESWQAQLSARGQPRPKNFTDKAARGENSAKKGLLLYFAIAKLDTDLLMQFTNTIPGVVKNRLWTRANIETRNLTSPDTSKALDKAEETVDASMDDMF